MLKIRKVPIITDRRVSNLIGKERSLANLRKGGGRAKGVPNKANKALKEMILGALEDAGGQKYLLNQALNNSNSFLALIGKVLPSEIQSHQQGSLVVTVSTGIDRS